jgi:arylsulfatase A-like enzyme
MGRMFFLVGSDGYREISMKTRKTPADVMKRSSKPSSGACFLAPLALLLMWLVWASPLLAATNAGASNIVLIMADDLGFGDLGCYGHPRFRTPNLDRMAAEGVRLTQFNTPAPFCAPTRAALLTGRYPARCGLTTNPTPDGEPPADALHLPQSERLLPEVLRDAGYKTGMIGKWHLGHRETRWWPTQRGFDQYLGILYSNDMRPVRLIDGQEVVEYPVVQATLTRRYTERALDFIEANRERPFFLYLAHAMPHKPLACSEAFYQKSGAGLYGDVISELDWSVGQVLAKLKEAGCDHKTLVIFTSDNGAYYGGSSGALRGMKGTAWEGGFRVPCILRWPGRLPAGITSTALGATMDLYATVLSAAGAKAPSDRVIDGRDLTPLLTEGKTDPERIVFCQGRMQLATARDARWKLHILAQPNAPLPKSEPSAVDKRAPDGVTLLAPYEQAAREVYPGMRGGDETKALSLFDLLNDPGEQHEVSAQHPEVVARLKAAFDAAKQDFSRRQ